MTDRSTPNPDDGNRLGGDDITPPRGTRTTDHTDDESDWTDGDSDGPNYLVRRVLIVVVAAFVIVAAAFVVVRLVSADSSGSSDDAAADWNTLVVFDDDDIRILDRDSVDEIASYDSDPDLTTGQTFVVDGTLVSLTRDGRLTRIDLSNGDEASGRTNRGDILQISPDNPDVAIAGPPEGGDVTIIRPTDANEVGLADVAELEDPRAFVAGVRINASGSHATIPVQNLFQSFLVDLDDITSRALAGRSIAIDDDQVVTEQPAGDESVISFYDLTGERLGSIDVPAPRAAMLTPDGSLLMVDALGAIRSAESDGSIDEVGTIEPFDGDPVEISRGTSQWNGDRFVVTGASRVFVLDATGEQIGTVQGDIVREATGAARCIVVSNDDDGLSLVDLDTADVVVGGDEGIVQSSSLDGCTVSVTGPGGSYVMTPDDVIDVDAETVRDVAPDGSSFVVVDGGRTELVDVESGDRTRLADDHVVVRFGNR